MKKIVLIGGGGHCKVVIDAIRTRKEYFIAGIIDIKENIGKKVSGVKIVSDDTMLEKIYVKGIHTAFISVGSVGGTALRQRLYKKLKSIGYFLPNILHRNTIIAKDVLCGNGNFISAGVIINTGTAIGDNAIINTGAILDHECRVGDFVHIAPGAVLSGDVAIGDYTHIGTGVSIIQGIRIGKNTLIGAGSVVVKDIGDNCVAYGNPCAVVRKNEK